MPFLSKIDLHTDPIARLLKKSSIKNIIPEQKTSNFAWVLVLILLHIIFEIISIAPELFKIAINIPNTHKKTNKKTINEY